MKRRPAFSLVELLVVMGIIAVIAGLILAVLGRMRGKAAETQCASNLRQIVQAMTTRAAETGGYTALAGRVVVPALAPDADLATALQDAARRRYAYVRLPNSVTGPTETVAPVQYALSAYVGQPQLVPSVGADLVRDAELSANASVWRCPAIDPATPGSGNTTLLVVGTTGHEFSHKLRTDFTFNEAVLGYYHEPAFNDRFLRGRMAAVRRPAQTLLVSDAGGQGYWPAPLAARSDDLTLADADAAGGLTSLDRQRHRGRFNVALADGHVATLDTTPAVLRGVLLWAAR